jgi:hypothetical protein
VISISLLPDLRKPRLNFPYYPLALTDRLMDLQDYYSNDSNADRIKKVQTQIAEVKDVMVDNIGMLPSDMCDAVRAPDSKFVNLG